MFLCPQQPATRRFDYDYDDNDNNDNNDDAYAGAYDSEYTHYYKD